MGRLEVSTKAYRVPRTIVQYMLWGWCADRFGRRITLMTTSLLTIPVAPLYLLSTDYTMIVVFFTLQSFFGGGGMHTQWPHYLSERFPTEVRATATGFCYRQSLIPRSTTGACPEMAG